MFRKLKLKMILIMMSIVTILIVAFCSVILVTNYVSSENEAFRTLENISRTPGFTPPGGSDKVDRYRSFIVKFNPYNDTADIFYDANYYTLEEIEDYIAIALEKGEKRGKTGNIRYVITEEGAQMTLAGIDRALESSMFSELLLTVLLVGAGGLVVLFALIWFLSDWIISPVKAANQKQKQFISDASHELKTPVTVISASCDLIENALEKGVPYDKAKMEKWLDNIKSQTAVMSNMANDLISLSKVDELNEPPESVRFDLSAAVRSSALPFESVAYEKGRNYQIDIDNGVETVGDEADVKKVAAILIDNAIKYSEKDSDIVVSLKSSGGKNVLSVYNDGCDITDEEKDKLFERFYRSATARVKSSGSGIGLSIVKSLATRNKWKLSVKTEPAGTITFAISM